MKISVVIPVYNGEKYIASAIQSVLRQSHQEIEIIVVNDASNDHTGKILSDYGDKIKVITNAQNKERSESRNIGMRAASGEYIAFLDADDVWKKNHILDLVLRAEATQADIVYAYSRYTDVPLEENLQRMQRIAESNASKHLVRYMINIQASMVKRDFVVRHKIEFLRQYRIAEDVVFFCQLLCLGAKVEFVKNLSVVIRRHDSNTTSDRVRSCKDAQDPLRYLVEWAQGNPEVPQKFLRLLRMGEGHCMMYYCLYSIKLGGSLAISRPRFKLAKLLFSPLSVVDRIRSFIGIFWPYFPLSKSRKLESCLFGQQ